MHKKRFGKYGRHKRMAQARYFWGLSALSVVLVLAIAMLSRAELRLSGELLAAGDGDDLAILMELHPDAEVELIRDTSDLRLYILHSRTQEHLIEVVKEGDEWQVRSVERLRE